jgi:hypothetical protein
MHSLPIETGGLTRSSAKLPIRDPLLLGQKRILKLVATGALTILDELILSSRPRSRAALRPSDRQRRRLAFVPWPRPQSSGPSNRWRAHQAAVSWRVRAGRPLGQRRAHPRCRRRDPLFTGMA